MVTAAFALSGALWFGLLSFGAAIAYEPAGVRPREIGLSSGTVLTQAAVGLVLWVVLLIAYVLVFILIFRARAIRHPEMRAAWRQRVVLWGAPSW